MANPTPTIQGINAFDATQGTTINFNVIGGTEIIRSSKIYLYSVETNSLILTHTYVSTSNIHILPPNTDSSIQYESGFSSADFTNEKQYYIRLQTFTDVSSSQGASGLSIATLFWCLLFPTIQLNSIESEINTTSYNFTAIYDTNVNTNIGIDNKLQQYKFDLYNISGQLEQTSGTIISAGTPLLNIQQYQINYNFTGLNNGDSYYIVLTCLSTEGMVITTTSTNFSVIIDMPSFAKAQVVNNACDGYIAISSKITNIEGETNVSNVSSLQGEIDLTNGGYLIWDSGFTFPTVNGYGQWTMQLWGRNFTNGKQIINLTDGGNIVILLNQGYNNDTIQTRADMYIYPYQNSDYCQYIYSNYIDVPDNTTNLNIWVRCANGLYEITLNVLE